MVNLFLLVAGAALGGFAAWLASNAKCREILSEVRAQLARLESDVAIKEKEVGGLQQELRKEAEEKVKAQTELADAKLRLEEQRQVFQEAEDKLANAFEALADKALKSNNQAFLELAKSTFDTVQVQARGDLEVRQQTIDGLIGPLKESLARYERQVQEMEKTRQGAYGRLDKQLGDLEALTGNLNVALRGSHTKVRGRWGELTLRNVAELANMSEHCDFEEQQTFVRETGRQRPDMIVNLPAGRRIPVDSKVPLEAFLAAVSAATEEERKACLGQHSSLVRAHMDRLAKQGYPDLFQSAPDIVVMFLPGESFLAAALEQDGKLLEDAMRKRVLLATPTVMIALLLAVHHGWQQQELAANAAEIKDLGRTLYDRIQTASGYLQEIGSALGKAVGSYNSAIRSLESRFFPAARKFKDLVIPTGEDIDVLKPVEVEPRALISQEWKNSEPRDLGQADAGAPLGEPASKV